MYSLEDENGNCLHRESYKTSESLRRCMETDDGKPVCGFQFEPTTEWKRKRLTALRAEYEGKQ